MTRYNPRTGEPETYQAGPYDQKHWYLQVGGRMPGGLEAWSNGFRLAIPNGTDLSQLTTAQINAFKAAFQTFYASNIISAGVLLEYMKYSYVQEDGKLLPGTAAGFSSYGTNVGGTGSLSTLPFQSTIAVTWRTNLARGLAHKGRFYLPLPALGADGGTGTISTTAADQVKALANQLLAQLNAATPAYLAVFSRKAGQPTHQTIVGCAVGRVWDTQRRRRKKLVEDYRV